MPTPDPTAPPAKTAPPTWWSVAPEALLAQLGSRPEGLTPGEVGAVRLAVGPNQLRPKRRASAFGLFLGQFKSPISLLLLGAALLSFFLRDTTDAVLIFLILLASGALGFWQEKNASDAVGQLLALVTVKTTARREGRETALPPEDLVPGDVLLLRSGDLIPADCRLLTGNELFVNEATLTGETYPVAKAPGQLPAGAPLAQRTNALFMGAHVVSGTGEALVVQTGPRTELGRIAERVGAAAPETDFERGIRQFGYLLMEVTLVLVILIFAINVGLRKPVLDAFLFSLAVAVGLTPQLLPAIISINLARGASRMAAQQVIVKRLSAIENFGSMNVLCSDKTGTLTEGTVTVRDALGTDGQPSARVALLAKLNASLQQGFRNPIDEAILAYAPVGTPPADVAAYPRVDEIPYDFLRKRLTILTELDGQLLMVTKGAVRNVLDACAWAETGAPTPTPLAACREGLEALYQRLSEQGFRTLGLATKPTGTRRGITKADETGMTFLGFVTLFDPPKAGIAGTLATLRSLGIELKMITGDNALVAATVARSIGIATPDVLTGDDLRRLSPEALSQRVGRTHVYAEIEPNQKESLILALQKAGFVVGYLGDGINDASALHAADVGISVDSAVSVAKESADIVLLRQNLDVLINGVREGRRTFANTMKYIFMATSANFGNMFSMAGASLFLPFLPLLPTQILLTNLLTDLPETTISTDNVEPEAVAVPARWDLGFIRRFMIAFGLLSSVFDYLSFGALLFFFRADEARFQTGWFVESVLSATLIVLVVRTRRAFYRSQPGRWLLLATGFVAAAALLLPLTPLGALFGFMALPWRLYAAILGIVVAYVFAAEALKRWFYHRHDPAQAGPRNA